MAQWPGCSPEPAADEQPTNRAPDRGYNARMGKPVATILVNFISKLKVTILEGVPIILRPLLKILGKPSKFERIKHGN